MREKRNWLSIHDASEGLLYVLFLLVLAIHEKTPRFFAVDNMDQSLNPRLARALIRKFASLILHHNKCVLMTTHSPLVLDGLDIKDDRIRIFTLDRSEEGYTTVRRITHSEALEEAERHGYPLSRLWVEGRLGGMPNV